MIQPLEYERGRVIYRDSMPLVSLRGGLTFLVLLVIILAGLRVSMEPDRAAHLLGIVFSLIGAAGAIVFSIRVVRFGVLYSFEIRTDGILEMSRLTLWSNIRRFAAYGSPQQSRVELFYIEGLFVQRMTTNRALAPARYEKIIEELRREVGDLYPQLKLGGYEQDHS